MKQCKICYLNIKYNTVINNRLQDHFRPEMLHFLLLAILKIYTFHGPSLYTAFLFLRLLFCTWNGATDTLLFYAHFFIYSYCQVCVWGRESVKIRNRMGWDTLSRQTGAIVSEIPATSSFYLYLPDQWISGLKRPRSLQLFVNVCCVYQKREEARKILWNLGKQFCKYRNTWSSSLQSISAVSTSSTHVHQNHNDTKKYHRCLCVAWSPWQDTWWRPKP